MGQKSVRCSQVVVIQWSCNISCEQLASGRHRQTVHYSEVSVNTGLTVINILHQVDFILAQLIILFTLNIVVHRTIFFLF